MKRKNIILAGLIAVSVMMGAASACSRNPDSGTNSSNDSSSEITYEQRYTLTYLAYELEVNEDFTLAFDDGTLASDVSWTSSDETIATVDKSGKVFAKKAGVATIKAENVAFWSECVVTVTDNGIKPLLTLNVQDDAVAMTKEDKYAISATFSYNNRNYEDVIYTYESSNSAIVSVDESGIISALDTGTATVTVTGTWRNGVVVITEFSVSVKKNIYVTLSQREIELYSCNPTGYNFALEQEIEAKLFDGATEQEVVFTVEEIPAVGMDAGAIATYADGKITSVAKGTTQFVFACEYEGVQYVSDPILVTVKTPIVQLNKTFEGLYDADNGVKVALGDIGVTYQTLTKITDTDDNEIVFDDDNVVSVAQVSAGAQVWRFYFDDKDIAYEMNIMLASKYLYTAKDFEDLDAYGYYVLKSDVDFNGNSVNPLFAFQWLGDACVYDLEEGFHGVFDGNGHTISNFVTNSYGGFFGTLGSNGVVKNVGFKDCSATNEAMLLFANVYGGTIENVSVNTTQTLQYAPIGILSVQSTMKNVVVYAPNCGANGLAVMTYNSNTTVENVYVVSNRTDLPSSAYLRDLDNYDVTYFDATAYLSDVNFTGIDFTDVFDCETGIWAFDYNRLLPFIKWVDFYHHEEIQYILTDDEISFKNAKFASGLYVSVGANVLGDSDYTVVDGELTLTKAYLDTIKAGEIVELSVYVSATEVHVYKVVRPTAVVTDLHQITDPNGYYILGGDIDASGFQYCRFIELSDGSNYSWYVGDGSNGAATTYQNEGFNGTLDGRGYTIKNINNVTYGLFAIVGKNGVIRNVHFSNFSGGELCEVVASCFFGTLENVSFYSEKSIWAPVGLACAGSKFLNVVVYTPSASNALYQQLSLSNGTTFKNVYCVSANDLGAVHWGKNIEGYDIHRYASLADSALKAIDFSELFDFSEDSLWRLDAKIGLPRIANGEEIAAEYVYVTFKDGEDTLNTLEVEKGSTITDFPSAEAGYVYTWTLNGETFDNSTSITEDITLVGTKTMKTILPSSSSYMQANGYPADTSKVTVTTNVDYNGEIAAMRMDYNPGSWVEVYAIWKFDVTSDDVAAWKAAGYTQITFKVYASSITGSVSVKPYGAESAIAFTNGTWQEITISLDTLAENCENTFWVSLGAYSYGFNAAITQPKLINAEVASTVKVTFKDGEDTLNTLEVEKGSTITDFPSAGAGYVYTWTLNGETFDNSTSITEDITLVGTKTMKTILPSSSSYMQADGYPADTSKVTVTTNVDYNGEIAAMRMDYNPGSWVEVYAIWKFDVTSDDVAAWKAAGYTQITFKVYASSITGSVSVKPYGAESAIAFTNGTWQEITISLDTLAENCENTFWVSLGAYSYGFNAAITQPKLINAEVASTVKVTFKDGEDTLNTLEVEKGSTITDFPSAGAGYVYTWTLNGETFDNSTSITEDVTLVGTKTMKTILPSSSSYMQANGDPADTSKVTVTTNVDYDGEIAAMRMDYNPGSWVEAYAIWKFDVTSDDVAAWKAAGYTQIRFKVYASSLTGSVSVKPYGAESAIAFTNGTWQEITISLDTLAENCENTFWVSLGAYSYGFNAAITKGSLN